MKRLIRWGWVKSISCGEMVPSGWGAASQIELLTYIAPYPMHLVYGAALRIWRAFRFGFYSRDLIQQVYEQGKADGLRISSQTWQRMTRESLHQAVANEFERMQAERRDTK